MKKGYRYCRYVKIFLINILLSISLTSTAKENAALVTIATMEQIPYGFKATNKKTTGVLYEILNNIMIESDIEPRNKLLPLNRLFAAMSLQQNMCSLTADTPVIVNEFDLIEPIGFPLNLGVLPKQGIVLDDYSSLTSLSIAVPLGVSFDDRFNNDKTLSIVSTRNYTNAVKMLKNGQVDAIAGAISTLMYIGIKQGMATTDFSSPLILSHNQVQLVCNHGLSKSIRQKLKNSVIALKSNGTIQKSLDDYFDKNQSRNKSN
jgi:hypothetical protein